jgi:MGT family glycosyltransferase
LRREGVDVVLADQNEPASATVSEYLGLPFASICTSLPINREPEIPPSFVGWDYGDGALVKLRNKLGYAVGDFLTRDLQRTLNTYRKRWGLAPLGSPENSFSKAAQVAQMPREFDFPRRIASNAVDYTGPWIDHTFESRFAGSEFPHEQLDGRPILYASLGTLQSSNSRHFELIAQACTGLDLQVVISVGAKPGVDLPKLAGNHLVVHFAPQIMLLKRSALTITHAGMNTTMHALQFGTPLIAIPLAHDQPAIGARLERAGAGIVLSPRTLTAKKLRCAIDLILEKNSPWQLEAKRMQVIIARSGGVARAADVLEQKLLKPRTRTALFQE